MRLIDADTLKAEFTGNFHEEWHYTGIRAIIDIAPTVEAEPVRHGHWVKNKDFTLMCSVCYEIAPYESNYYGDVIGTEKYPYCPYCGAKMDEVEE